MTLKYFKKLSAVGIAALLFATLGAGSAYAQTTITSTLTTDSSITVTPGADADFGTWFIAYDTATVDVFTIVMTTAGVTSVAGAVASVATNIVNADIEADLTVDLPTGVNGFVLDMTRSAIVDFADAALTLQSITYATITEGANQVFLPTPATEPVTVVTGGTPEAVTFGSTIAVTGQPADGAHTATYDVTFAL